MIDQKIKNFLDLKVEKYNNISFIENDPISIPHSFSKKEDIEISGFLAATIAWGNRKMIIKNAERMIKCLDYDPHNFILNYSESDFNKLKDFVHRTFNGEDFIFMVSALKHIYLNYNGLEEAFTNSVKNDNSIPNAIHCVRAKMFEVDHLHRSEKHIADPLKNSAAKRINMFLRWMVRSDNKGVDFGLWKNISPALLSCPLDVHSGNIARKLGLITRKQNDAKAVIELDSYLKQLDPNDPAKYDFALFGCGVEKDF